MAAAVFQRHDRAVGGAIQHDRFVEQRPAHRFRCDLAAPGSHVPGVIEKHAPTPCSIDVGMLSQISFVTMLFLELIAAALMCTARNISATTSSARDTQNCFSVMRADSRYRV